MNLARALDEDVPPTTIEPRPATHVELPVPTYREVPAVTWTELPVVAADEVTNTSAPPRAVPKPVALVGEAADVTQKRPPTRRPPVRRSRRVLEPVTVPRRLFASPDGARPHPLVPISVALALLTAGLLLVNWMAAAPAPESGEPRLARVHMMFDW